MVAERQKENDRIGETYRKGTGHKDRKRKIQEEKIEKEGGRKKIKRRQTEIERVRELADRNREIELVDRQMEKDIGVRSKREIEKEIERDRNRKRNRER